jgi:hypothetical protein
MYIIWFPKVTDWTLFSIYSVHTQRFVCDTVYSDQYLVQWLGMSTAAVRFHNASLFKRHSTLLSPSGHVRCSLWIAFHVSLLCLWKYGKQNRSCSLGLKTCPTFSRPSGHARFSATCIPYVIFTSIHEREKNFASGLGVTHHKRCS